MSSSPVSRICEAVGELQRDGPGVLRQIGCTVAPHELVLALRPAVGCRGALHDVQVGEGGDEALEVNVRASENFWAA